MKLSLRRLSLATPGLRNAERTWPARESLLLTLNDAHGCAGRGEASPLPGYSPDTLEQAEQALQTLKPADVAQALGLGEPWAVLSSLAALLPASVPSARMALETAGLDFLGQQRGQSAPSLLGLALPACAVAHLLTSADPEALSEAERAWQVGYRHFKLKVGAKGQREGDERGVAALRARLGDTAKLRLDANGSLLEADAEALCRRLTPLVIEFFEEPCAGAQRLATQIPIALDESLQGQDENGLEALVRLRGATVVVLKPMTLGGLSHAAKLASRALGLGVSVVVSHAFDGPLAFRACSALALSMPSSAAHGLGPHPGLLGWNGSPPPVHEGWLEPWAAPGLGESRELLP